MTRTTLDQVRILNPVTDAEVAAAVPPADRDRLKHELLARVRATPRGGADPLARSSRKVLRLTVRTAVPVLAAAGILAAVVVIEPDQSAPTVPDLQVANALTITTQGKFLTIKVVDLNADSERYNAELAAHGLNIKLELKPVSPSLVGTGASIRIAGGEVIQDSSQPVNCLLTGVRPCYPIYRMAADFKGAADIELGRPAKPGEHYVAAGNADAPKELLHGLRWRSKKAGEVQAMLAARGGRVASYRVENGSADESQASVPDDWYIYDAVPLQPGEVILWASPTPR